MVYFQLYYFYQIIIQIFYLQNKILTQIRSDYSAYGKLSLIEKQINLLKLEAINIINEYNLNNEINNIQCNFKKIPGNYYYIYSKIQLYYFLIHQV